MYLDYFKLFAKNKKELETLIQGGEKIQPEQRDGIWQRKMRLSCNEKWETTHDRRNGTTKTRSLNAQGKGAYTY